MENKDWDWFWKIFGSAIVGVISLLVVTMFGYFHSSINDVRTQLSTVDNRLMDIASKELSEIKKSIIITEKNVDLFVTRDLVQMKEKLASLDTSDKQQSRDVENALNKSSKAEEGVGSLKDDNKRIDEQIQQIREKIATFGSQK